MEEKKKIPWATWAPGLVGMIFGFVCAEGLVFPQGDLTLEDLVEGILFMVISFVGCGFIHELGHLIGGKLTGYHFLLFRLGSVALYRNHEGKFSLKKYGIPGTIGQCLLLPPRGVPFRDVEIDWYLLAGGVANFVAALFACIYFIIFPELWKYILTFILISIFFGGINLVPLKVGGICNDGYTRKLCYSDPQAHEALMTQLSVVGEFARGTTLEEMPPAWFYPKFSLQERMTSNPMVAAVWEYTGWRFLLTGDYFQAKIIFESIGHNKDLMDMQRNEALYDYLTAMLLEGRVEEVKLFPVTKGMKRHKKAFSKYFLSGARYDYAYATLVSGNGKRAKEAKAKFEKVAKKYPFEGEILTEESIMEQIDATY